MKTIPTLIVLFLLPVFSLALAVSCSSSEERTPLPTGASRSPRLENESSPSQTLPNLDEVEIWKGVINGLSLRWTTKDLYIEAPSGAERIFSLMVKSDIERLRKDRGSQSGEASDCEYVRHYKLLSVVDPLISFEDEFAIGCGRARPSSSFRFTTIDVNKAAELLQARDNIVPLGQFNITRPGPIVRLTDYFEEADIVAAMIANPQIANAIKTQLGKSRVTLADLSVVLVKNEYPIKIEGQFFTLDPDFLTRFAFHHLTDNRIVVQLSLSPTAAAAQASRGTLSLELPVPDRLSQSLVAAQKLERGFLSSNAEEISRRRATDFTVSF